MSSPAYWLEALSRASLQGALLVSAVWFALRLFRQGGPETRSWIWVLVLAKFALSLFFVWKLAVLPPPEMPLPPEGTAMLVDLGPLPVAPEPPTTLLWLWLAGAGSVACFAGIGHLRLVRTLRASTPASPEIRRLAREIAGREPDVRTHPDVPVPMISGVFRPVILVPESFADGLDEAEMRMVLAHELAHVERNDALARLFVFACQSLFFFHPGAWIARREWEVASESACDRWAMEATNATAHAYAAMLLKISVGSRRAPALALSVVPADKTLRRRIENMKITTKKTMLSRFGAFAAILTISTLALPFAFAQQEPKKEKPQPARMKKEQTPVDFAKIEAAMAEIRQAIDAGKLTELQGHAKIKALVKKARVKTTTPNLAKAEGPLFKATINQARAHELAGVHLQGKLTEAKNLGKAEGPLFKATIEQAKAHELAGVHLKGKLAEAQSLARAAGLLHKTKAHELAGVHLQGKLTEAHRLAMAEGLLYIDQAKAHELAGVHLKGKLTEAQNLAMAEGLLHKTKAHKLAGVLLHGKLTEAQNLAMAEGLLFKARDLAKSVEVTGVPIAAKTEASRVQLMKAMDEREIAGGQTRAAMGSLLKVARGKPVSKERANLEAYQVEIERAVSVGELTEAQGRAKIEALIQQMAYKDIRDRLAAVSAEIKKAVAESRMTPEQGKALIEEFKRALGGG